MRSQQKQFFERSDGRTLKKWQIRKTGWVYLIPAWLLLLAIVLVPMFFSFTSSFSDANLMNSDSQFIGFDNYNQIFKDSLFWEATRTTVIISGVSLFIQIPLGFFLAVLLNMELRGTALLRSGILMPLLLTPVAVGLMWRLMMNIDNGVINGTLHMFGLPAIDWLGDRNSAILSVILVDSWQNTAFVMLLLLAGLQNIPASPIEAAKVDGATTFQVYRHVILPLLAPVALVVVMIRIIESIKLFDFIYILTSGGPGTATQNISLLDFRYGFTFLQTAQAAALGIIITLSLTPMYLLWRRANRI